MRSDVWLLGLLLILFESEEINNNFIVAIINKIKIQNEETRKEHFYCPGTTLETHSQTKTIESAPTAQNRSSRSPKNS